MSEMGKIGRRVLEGQTCEDRQKARQKLGSLRSLTVSDKTRARYDTATSKLFVWLDENDLTLPQKREQLDGLVAEFVERLWFDGFGRAQACDTLAGLQDWDPKLKGHLQLSWRLMRTWSANEIPNRAPPLPQEAMMAMVGWAFFHITGELSHLHEWTEETSRHFLRYDQRRETNGCGRECHTLQCRCA